MEVYVNECSIHGQCDNQANFDKALQELFKVLDSLRKQKLDMQSYQDESWQVYQAINTEPFVASLHAVRQKGLRAAFLNVINQKLQAKSWQTERLHSPDDFYFYGDEVVTDTCMAEVAERTIQSAEVLRLLINFPESKFTGLPCIQIVKDETIEVNLDCIDQHTELEKWLELNLQLSRFEYDFDSTTPPTDEQTLLIDKALFLKTKNIFHGRAIYKEIKTNHFWYVDNLHFGAKSHIEVFTSTGSHIGEADLNGCINYTKCDNTKVLDI